jgi:hypothetical protein
MAVKVQKMIYSLSVSPQTTEVSPYESIKYMYLCRALRKAELL